MSQEPITPTNAETSRGSRTVHGYYCGVGTVPKNLALLPTQFFLPFCFSVFKQAVRLSIWRSVHYTRQILIRVLLILLATASALTLAAYLDAKFHLTKDLRTLLVAASAARRHSQDESKGRLNTWYFFDATASKYPDALAIWSREGIYTFRETRDRAAQYAHFFLSRGVKRGELVALYLQNRPEFIFAWLGLWCLGCAPAAINYNLAGDALVHCLRISRARIVLVDDEEGCRGRMEEVQGVVGGDLGMETVTVDETFNTKVIPSLPTTLPEGGKLIENTSGGYPAILLYTSGTTGMPKG